MKILIKTIQGKAVEMEVVATDNLDKIKKKVEEELKIPYDQQRIMHYGKALSDPTKTIADLGIKDGEFLVIMQTKVISLFIYQTKAGISQLPPVPPPPPAPAPASAPLPEPAVPQSIPPPPLQAPAQSLPQVAVQAPEAKVNIAYPPSTFVRAASVPNPPPAMASAAYDESKITMLTELGFTRDLVLEALTAAYGDSNRAADYLLNVYK